MITSAHIKEKWRSHLSRLDYALQPIVDSQSGTVTAFEARLRHHEGIGFATQADLFDAAAQDDLLHQVDLVLRRKAIEKFYAVSLRSRTRLLFRLDGRILQSENYQPGQTLKLLRRSHVAPSAFLFVVEEGPLERRIERMTAVAAAYRSQGFSLAVDISSSDMGIIPLLQQVRPTLVKINRRIVREARSDETRRILMANIVRIAHALECPAVAEGVDDEVLYAHCCQSGCDLIQGRLVQAPATDPGQFVVQYEQVRLLRQMARSAGRNQNAHRLKKVLEYIEPVAEDAEIFDVFETFRLKKHHRFLPVVTAGDRPIGIVREDSFKDYAYSRFGRDLLQNPAFGKHLKNFLAPFPVADINQSMEDILSCYAAAQSQEGVFIADQGRYVGYLSAQALLKIVNQSR